MVCTSMFFFFFQAEDGIRDRNVTGVQTCALPIYLPRTAGRVRAAQPAERRRGGQGRQVQGRDRAGDGGEEERSEERRVGKECRSRGGGEHEKKKGKEREEGE